ncbi:hypothetical protein LY76DRAFT_681654 [Colletotrichum caudatum]|nr:hypothetical protein LY76DRAFT_681654 [Colletotrichum caudatum]
MPHAGLLERERGQPVPELRVRALPDDALHAAKGVGGVRLPAQLPFRVIVHRDLEDGRLLPQHAGSIFLQVRVLGQHDYVLSTPSKEMPLFANRLSEGSSQMRDINSLSVWSSIAEYRKAGSATGTDPPNISWAWTHLKIICERVKWTGRRERARSWNVPRTRAPDGVLDVWYRPPGITQRNG